MGGLPFKGIKPVTVYHSSTSQANSASKKSAWKTTVPPGNAAAVDPSWEDPKSSNACQSPPVPFYFPD